MNDTGRRLAAEFLGTFALVFVSAATIVVNAWTNNALGLVGAALATALVYAVMVTMTMNISGGHLNPAVTIGVLVAKKLDGKLAGMYIVTQLIAAMLAALLVMVLLPAGPGEATSLGTLKISNDVSMVQAIILEAVFALFLVSAVFGTVLSPDAPKVGGFGVGMVLLFAILVIGPLTGASLNPARSFGPALVSGDFEGHVAYWIGPLVGALAGGLLWAKVLLPGDED
jgi:MIP family channel proteins